MGLHASHVPLAAARAHPSEVVVLAASTLHWPSFRPEGRRALYLARWYGGGEAAVGVHLWSSSAEALSALAPPAFPCVSKDGSSTCWPTQSDFHEDSVSSNFENSYGGNHVESDKEGELKSAHAGPGADENWNLSTRTLMEGREQDTDRSSYVDQRLFVSPVGCLVGESVALAADPLASWTSTWPDSRMEECVVILPLPSLNSKRVLTDFGSIQGGLLWMPVVYWPLTRPADSRQIKCMVAGCQERADVFVHDLMGRFPGRIFTLPCTGDDECGSEKAGSHSNGGNSGWNWVQRAGSEAAAGLEEAEAEMVEGGEEVVWFGRRAGIFLPLTVEMPVIRFCCPE